LSLALGQSPFLSVLSDSKVDTVLKLMTRPADTALTPEIAREVCQRAGARRISFKLSRAQKRHVSRPFCALFQRPTVSYPATSAVPSLSEEKTSDITAACAAYFAGVTACW